MFTYFVRRILLIIPTFFIATFVVFVVLQMTPGGPFERIMLETRMAQAASGEAAGGGGGGGAAEMAIPEASKSELKRYFNLDKPVPVRYALWIGKVFQGDFGRSYTYSEPTIDVILQRLPISTFYGLVGFFLSYIVCIPLGVWKAVKHGSAFDLGSSILIFIGYSVPGWALGAVLLVTLGSAGLFPLGEFHSLDWDSFSFFGKVQDLLHHAVLPIFAYMVGGFATLTVLMKNSLLENLGQDYIRTAFAKGLPERRVIFVHALRNSLIPILTGLGHFLGLLIAGSFLVEKLFNIDGFAFLSLNAVIKRDYTVVMAAMVIALLIRVPGNILSDIMYATTDPRIRFK